MRKIAHLLLIEDDRETLDLLVETLEEAGFTVDTASDGEAGLAAIQRLKPDLVLCDISMPGTSGFDVLERLTATYPRHADIPLVFLTALADRESVLRGRQLGADDYVTKPVDFEILIEVIKARLHSGVARARNATTTLLTVRETEVLSWVARGKASGDIAVLMGISERTVNYHVENAMRKLDVSTRAQAVMRATRDGIIR
jgi:DNA-binding NarL/FixJ family response regulator